MRQLQKGHPAIGMPLDFDRFMETMETCAVYCLVLVLVDKVFGLDRLESELSINVYVVATVLSLLSISIVRFKYRHAA